MRGLVVWVPLANQTHENSKVVSSKRATSLTTSLEATKREIRSKI
jgi:hypothetical protein